jgi:hypothetical protein
MVHKTAKYVPRNQKKYWRKISTKDIEDQLDDVRVQEMTGYVIFKLNRHYNNEKKHMQENWFYGYDRSLSKINSNRPLENSVT